jgi:hypothetical protein
MAGLPRPICGPWRRRPDCRLVTTPGIGHPMNLELPALYAGYFGAWFGGL